MADCLENCQNCINFAFVRAKRELSSVQKACIEQIFIAHKICSLKDPASVSFKKFIERTEAIENKKAFWHEYEIENCFYAIAFLYLKIQEKCNLFNPVYVPIEMTKEKAELIERSGSDR